ncbi:MAG: 50S ribosomal protein L9 [Candidatus Sungbacteria bacterium]|nr:50S ribosomal protein L9 [Candidatus Sungbacteria bacterium]
MKVILLQEIPKLGKAGDVKNASDGYARNFLIPRGLAKPATDQNVRVLEQSLAEKSAREGKEQKEFEAVAKRLQNQELRFDIKVGEKGQAFGSITAQDIIEKLAESGVKIDRRWIELEHGIKTAGEHRVKVKLPHHIDGEIRVWVEAGA